MEGALTTALASTLASSGYVPISYAYLGTASTMCYAYLQTDSSICYTCLHTTETVRAIQVLRSMCGTTPGVLTWSV
eukprot:3890639-Rhodomonas_salina.1